LQALKERNKERRETFTKQPQAGRERVGECVYGECARSELPGEEKINRAK
jgi:hypothetical protein